MPYRATHYEKGVEFPDYFDVNFVALLFAFQLPCFLTLEINKKLFDPKNIF